MGECQNTSNKDFAQLLHCKDGHQPQNDLERLSRHSVYREKYFLEFFLTDAYATAHEYPTQLKILHVSSEKDWNY